jgi:CRISPR-associated endonuclease Cas1
MMSSEIPWFLVSGFGAHIKSSQDRLIVLQKNQTREFPVDGMNHLLLIGGHTIHTSTITRLVKKGIYISFFEADGTPVGTLRPYGDTTPETIRALQQDAPRHRFAVGLVEGAIRSRLLFTQKLEETLGRPLLYEGESEVIHKALDELEYLIKLDEIRRLHQLTADMYYEILSRALAPELGFRRRMIRPQHDVVNAMFSVGYAMLYGNCMVSVLAAHLDPDIGILHEGQGGLVYDLIDPLKAGMIDEPIIRIAAETVSQDDYELSADRCMLSDELVQRLIKLFKSSLRVDRINEQVYQMSESLKNREMFKVLY